jgi:hypothetical protein
LCYLAIILAKFFRLIHWVFPILYHSTTNTNTIITSFSINSQSVFCIQRSKNEKIMDSPSSPPSGLSNWGIDTPDGYLTDFREACRHGSRLGYSPGCHHFGSPGVESPGSFSESYSGGDVSPESGIVWKISPERFSLLDHNCSPSGFRNSSSYYHQFSTAASYRMQRSYARAILSAMPLDSREEKWKHGIGGALGSNISGDNRREKIPRQEEDMGLHFRKYGEVFQIPFTLYI